jgi:arylsulfatase A-like enzyme
MNHLGVWLAAAWVAVAWLMAAPVALADAAAAPAARPPNVVFLLCDDLGTGDLGCLGAEVIRTPNIDRLFARGTVLARHWAGSAVCAPSRCVLMTGLHPGHSAVRSNREVKPEGQAPLPPGTTTIAGVFRAAGYATGAFGKWGLGAPGSGAEPLDHGFERFFGYNCQREAHTFYPQHLWSDRTRVAIDNSQVPGGPPVPRGGTLPADPPPDAAAFAAYRGTTYSADLIAAEHLAFVRRHADRPFFLYLPTTVPHLALQVPADEPSLADYERAFADEAPYLGGKGYVPCRHPLATFAAMVTRLDREVGKLVALLDELGLTDDTIFVFTSDNGGTFPGAGGLDTARLKSNGTLRDWKGSPYEGGLRVPTAVVFPGRIPAGGRIDSPTGCEDWLPTLLDLAGLGERIPAGLDGRSLAGLLTGAAPAPAERILYRELTEGRWQAVLEAGPAGQWKAIRRAVGRDRADEARPTELYDLATDPGEARDRAAEHPDVVRRLEALLDREHVPHPEWPLPFADAASAARRRAAGVRRPNILLVVTDDQSPFDLRCYDPAARLDTPVIDRLAREGMVLDAAYHMGSFSGAVCTPSRHMIMCGRTLWHLPIGPGARRGGPDPTRCPADIVTQTLPAVFNRAGYDTMRTCKLGNSYEGANRLFTVRRDATKRGGSAAEGSAWHADQVLAWLDERAAAGDDDPFLIHFGFSHPHDTRDGTPELLARYGAANHADRATLPAPHPWTPPLPVNWLPRHPFDDTDMRVRDEIAVSGVWERRDERTIRNEIGRQFACSANIDTQLGRVLDRLEATGQLADTWVIYTSDHGIAIGRHGLQGKQNLYEHSWRVPLVVRGPGVAPGSRAPGNVYLLDLLATLCDIAGIEAPATSEGTSFLPVLRGDIRQVRDVLYGAYCGGAKPGIRSLRRGNWKLVKYQAGETAAVETQLFDLATNPHELLAEHTAAEVTRVTGRTAPVPGGNLAAAPERMALRAELERALVAEMERLGDPFQFADQPAEAEEVAR